MKNHQARLRMYGSITIIYLLISWLTTLIFDPYHHLLARLILFTLALLPLAFLVRIDDNQIVIVFSIFLFNLMTATHALFFPHFYSIITPLFPIFYEYNQFFPVIANYNQVGQIFLSIARWGYLIDLAGVLIVAGLISIISQKYNRVRVNQTRRYLKVILLVGAVGFLLVFPYLIIASTGSLQFGLSYTSAAVQLQEGVEEIVNTGNLSNARPFFVEAVQQYQLAKDLFNGLDNIQLQNLILTINPALRNLLTNGDYLIRASFAISNLFLPLIDGLMTTEQGFSQVSGLDLNQTQLNQIITETNHSRGYFQKTQNPLEQGLQLLSLVDITEFSHATDKAGIGDYHNELELLRGSGNLFQATLRLFLLHLRPLKDHSFSIEHALRAIYETKRAQEQIGNQSRYRSLLPTFRAIRTNLTVVNSVLDENNHTQYQALQQVDTEGQLILAQMRTQLLGIFNFFRDLVNVGISLADFGTTLTRTLQLINNSLLPLTSDLVNFPTIPDPVLRDGVAILANVRTNTTSLQDRAINIEQLITQMSSRAMNQTYGIFSSQAENVVSILQAMQLEKNAKNFYHLSSASYYLLLSVWRMQDIAVYLQWTRGNMTTIENQPQNSSLVNSSRTSIQTSITKMNQSLVEVRANLTLAKYHLNQVENMPEADQLRGIINQLEQQLSKLDPGNYLTNLQQFVDQLQAPVENQLISEINNILASIDQTLQNIDTILQQINIKT